MLFLFSRVQSTALLLDNLAPEHRPFIWNNSYADVLPYLHAAFGIVLEQFEASVPPSLRADLVEIATQLCNPDPRFRGHPLNRHVDRCSVARYVTRFDLLAHRARAAALSILADAA